MTREFVYYECLGVPLETRLIYEFSELAKRLSITDTARFLNMSQPTLSKHINQLEKDLHVTLFYRSPNGLRITREGLELLNEAYTLIESADRFTEKAAQLRKNPLPSLKVAGLTNEEAVVEMLGDAVSSLSAKYGAGFLEIEPDHRKTPFELVEAGVVDIAFDYLDEEDVAGNKVVEAVPLQRIQWYAVVSATHPFANRESVSIADLEGQTLLRMEGSRLSHTWAKIENKIRDHGITPILRYQYSMKLIDLITASASLGTGVFILGENFVDKAVPANSPYVKAVPFSDDDANLVISGLFRMDNSNVILDEMIALISEG